MSNQGYRKERRASERRPIHLACEMLFGAGDPLKARVEDFCAEGIYVRFDENLTHELLDRSLEVGSLLQVRFATASPPRLHELSIEVRRIVPGGVGGLFVGQYNAPGIGALLEQATARAASVHETPATPTASLILKQCERIVLNSLTPLVENYTHSLPDQFDEAIAQAASDNQKTLLVDSLIVLRRQLPIFRSLFLRHVSDALLSRAADGGVGRSPDGEGLDTQDLSLVAKEEFEEWLALKVMITKAETLYRNHLLQLKMRLDTVGLQVGRGYANPLGPPLICNALREALGHLRLPVIAERLCLKAFETRVMQALEPMYEELNQALIRAGILPNLNLNKYFAKPDKTESRPSAVAKSRELDALRQSRPVAPKPAAPEPTPPPRPASLQEAIARGMDKSRKAEAPPADPAHGGAIVSRLPLPEDSYRTHLHSAEASVTAARQLFRLLEEGQRLGVTTRESRFPQEGEAPVYSNREIFQHLVEVQTLPSAVIDEQSVLDASSLRDRMYQMIQRQQEGVKALSGDQDKALEMVDRFFASVLRNPKITTVAKNQIKSLELPILKLVIRNPDFFHEEESIPKQVINRIAQLGLKGTRLPRASVERINQLVSRIQNDHDSDPSIHEEVLGELDAMLERQNLLFRRNVERVAAAAEGQQKIQLAKQAVGAELNRRLGGKRVPRAVMTLINGGWRDLLSLTWVRQGPDSREWSDYLSVIDTLQAFAQDPDSPLNLRELLRVIQEGLASISSHQMPSGHIRDELKRFLVTEAGTPSEWVEVPEEDEATSDPDLKQVQEARQRGLQRWLARVQRLQSGDWLRLEREGKEPDFIRLVWVGSQQSRFVFVNHQGMKVIDLDAVTLAAYLQKGIAQVEANAERSVFDESLDEMVRGLYEQLSFVSTHDELTGLLQRKEFERQLSLFMAGQEGRQETGIVLVSIDQFRLINDSAGLEAGDKALRDIARILRNLAPGDHGVCRFGGDEFMLHTPSPAQTAAEQIAAALGEYRLKWQGQTYSLNVSIGYADAPGGTTDVVEFLQRAEAACREAKAQGGRRLVGYQTDARQQARKEAIAAQVAQLDKKLSDQKILLRCQKIIPLHGKTRSGTQYEILLSVYDPTGNLIPAGEFVRAAENYRRMQEVDRWVVGHALDWLKDNRRQIEAMGGIAINLSGHSLNDEKLLEFIFERLTQYDVPLDKVCFEITEAAAITRTHDVAEFMQEMQEYGCRFCLGHFGSGVSYQLLKQLPVDMIKIDGIYMRELASDNNDRMMVRSMTEMAHYLGREIIGPHVESKETFEALKEIGVDYAQGYFIERPKSLANF